MSDVAQETWAPPARKSRQNRRGLSPDWLPVALLIGDSVIAAAAVLIAYWYRFHLDTINRQTNQELDFGPYLGAVPFVALIFVFSLAVNRQYRSWRGRTLVDQLLSLYSGVALAAVLMLAAISVTNTGLEYSRLTLVYSLVFSAILMTL